MWVAKLLPRPRPTEMSHNPWMKNAAGGPSSWPVSRPLIEPVLLLTNRLSVSSVKRTGWPGSKRPLERFKYAAL